MEVFSIKNPAEAGLLSLICELCLWQHSHSAVTGLPGSRSRVYFDSFISKRDLLGSPSTRFYSIVEYDYITICQNCQTWDRMGIIHGEKETSPRRRIY